MSPDDIDIDAIDDARWIVSPQVYADCVRLFGQEWADERCRPWSFLPETEGEDS